MSFPIQRIHVRIRRALLLAGWLLLAVPALAATPTVMVFGDSLAAAYNLSAEQGWVNLLAQRAHAERRPWRVVNASVSGETTAGGLRRLPEDLKRHRPAVVVIELGANDALRGLPVALMRSNLEQMIRLVRNARAEPVLVGMMIPPNYGIDYAAQFRDMYAALAASERLAFMPFLLEGFAEQPDLFQADQLHPTAAAQPRIAAAVWAVLEPVMRKAK